MQSGKGSGNLTVGHTHHELGMVPDVGSQSWAGYGKIKGPAWKMQPSGAPKTKQA